MKPYIKFLGCLVMMISLLSCRKYVEDVPIQGQRVLVYTQDFRYLMDYRDQFEKAIGLPPVLCSDDIDLTAQVIQDRIVTNIIQRTMYTWGKPFYLDRSSDYDWDMLYNINYYCNVVINGVLDSKNGLPETKNIILGEALIHRAYNFFMLVNMYAKQYDAASADKDLGVPILIKPELLGDLTRSSVKHTYERILADIRQAIPLLPNKSTSNTRPSKAAAYALLSKVYLNMRDFTNAAAFADSTLAISSQFYDYNTAVAGTTPVFPAQLNDVQILLRKVPRTTFSSPLQLSQPMLDLLSTKDLRYELFVRPGTKLNPNFTGFGYWSRSNYASGDGPAIGLSVNETWLIKAECLARSGKKDEAVTMLNTLRKFRFRPADYADLSAATPDAALQLVVDERRREFFGTGMRWFDQRRLNKDALFAKKVTRVFNNVTYTLEPDGNGYVFPLASILIAQNPEIEQNP